MEKTIFTEHEMEAALQLIQLSGESEQSSGKGKKKIFVKKRRQEDRDYESQGSSSTSDVTSHVSPRFAVVNDGDEDYDSDGNMRKNKKKFRSIVEVYKISR
ncbi:hypothetical protein CTI12_AA387470 [Artemisia annua]|uniref:Uncharacterized protein n=1 Tax=Artemisia annua TaxID=35608 RepID=A0A2U1MEQ9_ARTAN|nr:hypothetical protein CTI12_AA387470 [Artemisia annua]